MTFNQERAEALRTAIIGTSQTIRHYPEGDAKNLLTEHLALLQEAELIYLTDAFVGENSIGVDESRVPQDGRVAQGFNATVEGGRIVNLHEPFFPDIRELDRAAGRVRLGKEFVIPHAELRKTWAPGQRWQVLDGDTWLDTDQVPKWNPRYAYRRHPDDIDPLKPWYPDDSGEWVEVPDNCMTCPVPTGTRIEYLLRRECNTKRWRGDVQEAGRLNWSWSPGIDSRIVAYKVVK